MGDRIEPGDEGRLGQAVSISIVAHFLALAALGALSAGAKPGFITAQAFGTRSIEVRLSTDAGLQADLATASPVASLTPVPAPSGLVRENSAGDREQASTAALQAALPRPTYLPTELLDISPQPATHIEPVFPPLAPTPTGRVKLRLLISERGSVDEVVIESADNGLFMQSAIEAFGAARFTPGIKNGMPVKSALAIEVRFGEPPVSR